MTYEFLPKALAYASGLVLLYTVSTVTYNLFLHPLRKYPGPWFYAATPFPRLYLYISGREPWVMKELHLKYGKIVRFAPNELSFIEPQAWQDIYGHKNTNLKDRTVYPISEDTKKSILVASEEDHPRQRKMFLPAFSSRALRQQHAILDEYVYALVGAMRKQMKAGEEVEMVRMFNFVAFDTIADLTFGESLGLLENMKYSPWLQAMFESIGYVGVSRALQHFPLLWSFLQLLIPRRITDMAKASFKHSADRVDKRLEMRTERPDIFGLMLKHTEGGAMSIDELHANADLLMIAGTETTASTLSGLFWCLLKNERCMRTLREEIVTAFPREADIDMDVLPQLPYLSACLEETFRMYPAVAEGVRRLTHPKTGSKICGQNIPPNMGVSVPHYAAYHSPQNFHLPDTFIPERWLPITSPNHDSRFSADKKEVLQPFHIGPRNCVGRELAYHELRLVVAHVLWNFDFKLAQRTSADWFDQKCHVVWEKKPLWCEVSERKR